MVEKTKEDGEISMEDAVKMLDNLKEEINFDKPESELTPEEVVKKMIYTTLDKEVEKGLGKEQKGAIDRARNKISSLKKFTFNIGRLTGLGQEIEKNFILQFGYISIHFDRSENNFLKTAVNRMSEDMIKKPMSNSERLELANNILNLVKPYREKIILELHKEQELIYSLLPQFEKICKDTDFNVFNGDEEEKNAKELEKDNKEFIHLSKELSNGRALIIKAVEEDISMEEILPKYIIENNGDNTMGISSAEMMMKGERVLKYSNEANKIEEELGEKRLKLAEKLFGKAEDYMGLSKDKKDTAQTVPVSKSGNGIKWIVVIVLSIIALSGGVWTAIGVFVLGAIIISILSGK